MDYWDVKEDTVRLYDGHFHGAKVSDYGLQYNRIDYRALARAVGDYIYNGEIFGLLYELGDWEDFSGEYINWTPNEEEEEFDPPEVFQWFIISYEGAKLLRKYTEEIVIYHEKSDIHLWGITHYGTNWTHVLTDIKIDKSKEVWED